MGILSGNDKSFEEFKKDAYVFAVPTAIFVANIPAGKHAATNDPKKSCKILFTNGEARKWTRWMSVSYTKKSTLPKVFNGCPDIAAVLQSVEDPNSDFWKRPFQIMVENTTPPYSDIVRVKYAGEDEKDSDGVLLKDKVGNLFYDVDFTPYKYVKAFGNLVKLEQAIIKAPDGVKVMEPDSFIDPPNYD